MTNIRVFRKHVPIAAAIVAAIGMNSQPTAHTDNDSRNASREDPNLRAHQAPLLSTNQ